MSNDVNVASLHWRASVARQLVEAGCTPDEGDAPGASYRYRTPGGAELVHDHVRDGVIHVGQWGLISLVATTNDPYGPWRLPYHRFIDGGTVHRTLGDAVRALDLLKEG